MKLTPDARMEEHPFLLCAEWTNANHSLLVVRDYDLFFVSDPSPGNFHRITKTGIPGVVSNGAPDWLYEEEILGDNKAFWVSPDNRRVLFASFNDSMVGELKFTWYGTNTHSTYPSIRSLSRLCHASLLTLPRCLPLRDSCGTCHLVETLCLFIAFQAGTNNPLVTLHVADIQNVHNSVKIYNLKPPMDLTQSTDYYFCDVTWVSGNEVSIVWLNREQNVSMISLCKSPAWYCQMTQKMDFENEGWVDVSEAPVFNPDGSAYLTLFPIRDGHAGYFRHIISYHIGKKAFQPLTQGLFSVNQILAWDSERNKVYSAYTERYMGTPNATGNSKSYEDADLTKRASGFKDKMLFLVHGSADDNVHIQQTMLFVKSMADEGVPFRQLVGTVLHKGGTKFPSILYSPSVFLRAQRVTLYVRIIHMRLLLSEVIPEESLYKPCTYHKIVFSPDLRYFVNECLGPGIPTVKLYETRFQNGTVHQIPKYLMTLQNNSKLHEKLSKLALPQIKSFPVQISGGYYAQVRLYYPPRLREDEITRYPLVLQVYGGPGSQLVTDRWKIDWNTYLAGNRDYIVAQIDGRGSSGQGYKLLHQVYKKLGVVEVSDQLEVTDYLREALHVVDARRIAVWGWSYGGFVSAMLLSSPSQDVFHCAIAVAPVTSWKLYDSAYTERYMGTPNATGNSKSYEDADLTKRASGFKDKMLFLVHGSADDNVHIQQTMLFVKSMADEGVPFRQLVRSR
ncbi:prolyl endopeptidase FAP [Diaphorina citri]|uniref:Venom dipeptidyl peptidase 4 n=1 Tax=Diaphorina citri TaxID=121845 RepID=A0A3Q0J1Q1_DIACI|nr:prolyl endopeptidase FAP [Diaphorina citri]